MQKISPCLWFDRNAEEAIDFYTGLFDNSRVTTLERYPESPLEGPMEGMEGQILTAIFELKGYQFMALDGGPLFQFNPSISFFVNLESKEEVSQFWDRLSQDGTSLMPLAEYPFSPWYGWIQDRFGVTWQLMLAEGPIENPIFPSMLFVGDLAGKAEEALNFYTDVFRDARIGGISRYGAGQAPDEEGTIAYGELTLEGQQFAAMDSAHQHDFTFNEAISLHVECQTQQEVDHYWEALSAVPEAEQCGWLKDKYGVSWQIVPEQLGRLMSDPDPEKSGRVMEAMLQMKKIDIAGLEEAHAQR